jgi:hypothetical protein
VSRLPTVSGDVGIWGEVLNDFLLQSHTNNGYIKSNAVDTPQIKDSAVTTSKIANGAVTAPKLVDGPASDGQVLTYSGGDLSWSTPASAPVSSVAGRTGVVTLTSTDVGLASGAGLMMVRDTINIAPVSTWNTP